MHITLLGAPTIQMQKQDLILLNDGSPTRLNPTGLNSHIDLTAVNARIASASAWATVNDTIGSDHLPQQVALLNYIAQGNDVQCSGEHKFLLEKANWAQFRDLCSDLSLADVHSQDSNHIPVSSGKVKTRNKVPLWHEACSKAWKQATVLFLNLLSEVTITIRGTPQGSVISPTLFSLIENGYLML
ncbi:hypothetical protein DPMN_004691 [Dreissena polymorpha]|uniref:Reverse transcriptase n=1 Tax=Dreissena polymorpha TaxID=45954 RepID=A0A9D4RVU0_DREPO|nr:hypothetical protein DPMN_004691 [Dreissena polymorpha]